ncbi:complement component receptor 1-like protein [Alligator sinensis]|uniref:Complement component receptor 1-like protein n=1 Tax=Alligator sinensis TaxID=38654 RepID=A0A3Q0H9I9_ALLSI|nr:complement component receptor 1-like protein [Alligator sinensis]
MTDAFLGSAVTYSCNEGYRLIGKDQRRCEISGKTVRWSGDVPICQNIPCLPPPDIPHGRHSGTFTSDFVYGSVVTYRCDKGYTLVGEDFIYCTTKDEKNGEWSGPAPECQKTGKQCSYPPAIANGKHSGQGRVFTIGTSVTYSCDPGYTLMGRAQINCTASKFWTDPIPHCKVSSAGCRVPEVWHGKISDLKPAYSPGETLLVECDPGYTLKSTQEAQCQDDGTWAPAVPICEPGSHTIVPQVLGTLGAALLFVLLAVIGRIICWKKDGKCHANANTPPNAADTTKQEFSSVL